jgi:transposase
MAARKQKRPVTGGVDTHKATHHAAVVDQVGRVLGTEQFDATGSGYRALLVWMRRFGDVVKIGVEGTGSYGAGLARYLGGEKITVVEVDRPDRRARRRNGKSDPLDAISAALAALSGRADGTPKTRTGPVEAIRVLRTVRASAVKARTAALNELHALVVTAPESLRATLRHLNAVKLVAHCAGFVVDDTRLANPEHATTVVLNTLARRIQNLNAEIMQADKQLKNLLTTTAPRLCALPGVGPGVASQMLVTAGDNPDRLRSEGAFGHLCGVAPIPASSGTTNRLRLNRGGDRRANHALYMLVLSRLANHPQTRAYKQRRTTEGKTTKEIIRCLKRYAAREIHTALQADLAALNTP